MSAGKFHSKTPIAKRNLGDHNPSQCNHKLNGKLIHHKPQRATEGKEMVKLYEMGGERLLIVPNIKPLELPAIFPKSEFERLKSQAHVITSKNRIAMLEEANQKKNQLQEESDKRKEILQKNFVPQTIKEGTKLRKIENEAQSRNQYLLQRAHELRKEQEDEVKKVNQVILATKCRAIRNAQIAEKTLIQKQLEEEEKRLDMMMEQSRQKGLLEEEKKKEVEEKKNQKYVKEVTEQMQERELQRLLDAERIEEESRMINKALIAMQKEEEERQKQKHKDNMNRRNDLLQANTELERYRLIQKEEERIAEMRVQEFMRKKAEREAVREEELAAIKASKEREIARLRGLQQKAQDQQAILDEMNAQRIQEEVEREWREKEKQLAQKKKEELLQLHVGREKQIDDLRKAQAIEIARDEHEFHQVAKVQAKLHEQEQQKKLKLRESVICHREELLKQINEKEHERINQVQEKFEEGNALRLEKEVRELRVKEYVAKKVKKLRECNLPDAYIKDIERQLKIQ